MGEERGGGAASKQNAGHLSSLQRGEERRGEERGKSQRVMRQDGSGEEKKIGEERERGGREERRLEGDDHLQQYPAPAGVPSRRPRVILLYPSLHLVGVSIVMQRGCQ